MKLLGSLYSIVAERPAGGGRDFVLRLNPAHFIYKAHFPGEPVTPGVCIMQMAVELIGITVGREQKIKYVKNIKFLQVISPVTRPEVCISVRILGEDGDMTSVRVEVAASGVLCAKLSMVCQAESA